MSTLAFALTLTAAVVGFACLLVVALGHAAAQADDLARFLVAKRRRALRDPLERKWESPCRAPRKTLR